MTPFILKKRPLRYIIPPKLLLPFEISRNVHELQILDLSNKFNFGMFMESRILRVSCIVNVKSKERLHVNFARDPKYS